MRITILLLAVASMVSAQGPPRPARPQTKAGATVDLTGWWVSVITEDWRWRMVTPAKGDAASVPINAKGRAIVDAWDPAKDEAAGLACKGYGAPALMRTPTRLHITWENDTTLKIEADNGTQTRLLRFGNAPAGEAASWQGTSVARWETATGAVNDGGLGFILGGQRQIPQSRTLAVTTTNLREGYLRKNGVPYSARTTLNEYFDLFTEPAAEGKAAQDWLTVLAVVNDPEYLATPFVVTSDFKREPDGGKWKPAPCSAR